MLSQPEAEILEPGGAIFYAHLGDTVIGTCALNCESAGNYELTKMAVDQAHQGLGVGRLLMEAAIDEFKRRKGALLFLETSTKLGPALRLYESVGFQYQKALKPNSHYARADVYMVWAMPDVARPDAVTPELLESASPARKSTRKKRGSP